MSRHLGQDTWITSTTHHIILHDTTTVRNRLILFNITTTRTRSTLYRLLDDGRLNIVRATNIRSRTRNENDDKYEKDDFVHFEEWVRQTGGSVVRVEERHDEFVDDGDCEHCFKGAGRVFVPGCEDWSGVGVGIGSGRHFVFFVDGSSMPVQIEPCVDLSQSNCLFVS